MNIRRSSAPGWPVGLLFAAIAICLPVIALARTYVPPLPEIVGPVPVTDDSIPWLYYKVLQRPLDLDGNGFIEEEYFISGKANVYDWGPANARSLPVLYADAPYSTRILLRRPADPDDFSGNVYVEVMNPARSYDLNIFFSYMAERMLQHGDAWIGVTTGSNIDGLKRYDAARYASVQFRNPAPADRWVCPLPAGAPEVTEPNPVQASENGLRFDVLSQLARLLKSDAAYNPLADLDVEFVYMVSHTGGDVATYSASVAREARQPGGGPIYDGYVIKTGSPIRALNNCGDGPEEGDPRAEHGHLPGAPVILVKMQGDVPNARRPDSDARDDTFRLYELPGGAHADRWPYGHLPLNRELRKAVDILNDYNRGVVTDLWPYAHACNVEGINMNDFPVPYFVRGVLANLDDYKRNGTPLPRFDRIRTMNENARSPVVKDEFGNALGGVRTVWVDAPTKTWFAHTPGEFRTCYDLGYSVDWSWSKLEAVYGSYENWAGKASESIDRMIAQRVVTPEDGEKIRSELITPVTADNAFVPLQGDHIITSQGDLVIHPVNHASLVMQWNGKTIYVDPVGGAEPYINLPRPDLVLVTDTHGDHFNADTLYRMGGAPVVAPPAVYERSPDNMTGLFTTVLENGDTATLDGIGIEAVPMYNISEGREQFHTRGRGNGYLLTLGDKRVYIAGDTEPTPEMLALKDIDVAFIPMNLPYTMTVQQAAEAVRTFRPGIVYPYHYRGSDVEEFRRLVGDASDVRLRDWY